MSNFEVKVCSLKIKEHPNADRLEIAQIGGFKSIVSKGQYKTGDLAVYIPEESIVPHELIEKLGLVGKLGGSKKNRVKAIRFRGLFSQGLVFPIQDDWVEGMDVKDILGIEKYEPVVPSDMEGDLFYAGSEYTIKYDIENVKKYPNLIRTGEMVQITEKIHGTFFMVSAVPSHMENSSLLYGRNVISSKGYAQKGFSFCDSEKNKNNVYLRVAKENNLFEIANKLADELNEIVIIAGEAFGRVQDLKYGVTNLDYRVFDVAVGEARHEKRFFNHEKLESFVKENNLKRVPILYVGAFSDEILEQYTSGKESVSGKEVHLREGVVVKTLEERYDEDFGRVFLKSVSEEYLLRKGGTEFT
jgi:RNA ligase (TIGR02306 family)